MKKLVSLICLGTICASLMTGCGTKSQSAGGDNKLTYWVPLYPHISQTAKNLGETELYQQIEKDLGIDIEFQHPAAGQEATQFGLICASDQLPDIIQFDMTTYPGGAVKAIEDGVILDLKDIIETKAPNLKRVLDENPEWEKSLRLSNGGYAVFPCFMPDDMSYIQGLFYRKDLADQLNLPVPETISDWETMLKGFKSLGVEYPLSMTGTGHGFMSAFNTAADLYQEDGKVKFAPVEDNYKEYLRTFRRWNQEGLFDPDYGIQDGKVFDAKATSGKVGAYHSMIGGGIGKILPVLQQNVPNAELVAAPLPKMTQDSAVNFATKENRVSYPMSVAISADCKNVDLAVKLLDYGYSEAGHILFNFGIENESYTMQDGKPVYTDQILKNPEGLSVMYALCRYSLGPLGGPFVEDKDYYEQYLTYPEQKEALKLWSQQKDRRGLPQITLLKDDVKIEDKHFNIYNYTNEAELKFINGQLDIDKDFDNYKKDVENMGLQEVLDAYQRALDEYNAR